MADPAKKKYRRKSTGEEYWGDEFGTPLTKEELIRYGLAAGTTVQAQDNKIKPPLGLIDPTRPYLEQPKIPDIEAGKVIAESLPGIGGIAGSIIGTPFIGGAAGAGLGSSGQKLIQSRWPQIFGEYKPESIGEIVGDVGEDAATDMIGTGIAKTLSTLFIPSVRRNFIQKVGQAIFKPKTPVPVQGPYGAPIDLTVGQVNPGGFSEWAENNLAQQAKAETVAQQQSTIDKFFRGRQIPAEMVPQVAQQNALANVENWKTTSKNLYEAFEPHISANSKNVQAILPVKNRGPFGFGTAQPVTRTVKVEGAIPVVESKGFADRVGPELDKILGPNDINEAALGTGTGTPLKRLRDEINKIRGIRTRVDPATGQHMPDPVAEYRQLKALKDTINTFLYRGNEVDKVLKDQLRGGLRALASTIDRDIDAGIKSWGPKAYKDYTKAQNYYREMATKVEPQMAEDLLKAGHDPETTYNQVARMAISDPQKTRQFIKVAGDTQKAEISKIFMNDLANAAYDGSTNTFSPARALEYLASKEQSGVAKEALTPAMIKNTKDVLMRANRVKEPSGVLGNALNLTRMRAVVSVGVGLGAGIYQGDLSRAPLYSGAIFFSPMAANAIIKRTLLDTKFSKVVQGLQNADPASAQAKSGMRALLATIKGLPILMETKDGQLQQTTAGETGRIILPNLPE
jgi:hypothetical protein